MRLIKPLLGAVAIGNAISSAPALAQGHLTIQGNAPGRVKLDLITSIPDSGVTKGAPLSVQMDHRGRLYIARDATIYVWTREGKFLRTVGRKGQGPGEYHNAPRMLFTPGDTMLVFDGPRMTVLSRDYRVVATHEFSGGTGGHMISVGRGRYVRWKGNTTPTDTAGVYLVDSAGIPIRPIVARTAAGRRDLWMATPYASANGRIWTKGLGGYVMELHDTTGSLITTVSRPVAWFSYKPAERGKAREGSIMTSMWEDDAGRLWVMLGIEKKTLATAAIPTVEARVETTTAPDGDLARVIEVLDVHNGKALAAGRVPQMRLAFFMDSGVICSPREDENGEAFLDFWRVSILQ